MSLHRKADSTIGPPGTPDTDTLDVCFAHLYHEHDYMSLHITA